MKTTVEPPLVIDCDGTLLRTDLLIETGLIFFKTHPLRFLEPFFWLATQGKAHLKERLAQATNIEVSALPYDAEILKFVEAEREKGRKTVLATASNCILAERIASHLQLFDQVIASDAGHNCSASAKKEALVAHFGEGGFDYMGNSRDDIPVWQAARYAYIVNPGRGVERRARGLANVKAVLFTGGPSRHDWLKALRLHQWLKNLLIFVPLMAAHRVTDASLLLRGLLAFLLFGLCASSVYLLNDLLDLSDDRHHPSKRQRPFASGRLPVKWGLVTFPLLLFLAFGGALCLLPIRFVFVLTLYYGLTLGYSLRLKRYMMVDVMVLALLYTLRILAGASAVEVPLTFWMLAFSMCMFLSLALVKRYAELHKAREHNLTAKIIGRGYHPDDLAMIAALGGASGYMAVLVLALYIHDSNATVLYRYPQFIWLACPLLLIWVSRVWVLAHRGQVHEDPIVFAIRDRSSLVIFTLLIFVFWAAS